MSVRTLHDTKEIISNESDKFNSCLEIKNNDNINDDTTNPILMVIKLLLIRIVYLISRILLLYSPSRAF